MTESMVRYLPRYEDGVGMDPWSFIRSYEEEIERIPAEGFTKDQLCRKLFSFTLGYEPKRWIARLEPRSLKTWGQVVEDFLARFMPYHETIALRDRIQYFEQGEYEQFFDAYERFEMYKRECPYHRFEDGELIWCFVGGLREEERLRVDRLSGGLGECTVDEAEEVLRKYARGSTQSDEVIPIHITAKEVDRGEAGSSSEEYFETEEIGEEDAHAEQVEDDLRIAKVVEEVEVTEHLTEEFSLLKCAEVEEVRKLKEGEGLEGDAPLEVGAVDERCQGQSNKFVI